MEHSPADSQEKKTQQEEAGDPTQQEEAGDQTQQEEAGDQTQQEEAGDPTQQEEAGDQTQQEEAGDPTQQEEAGDQTQQEEAGDPTQQEEAGDPTQQEEAGDPTQQEEAGDQTQQEEAGDSTQQEEVGDPTQQEEAGDPTQQEEAGDPTQQEEAGDPTQQEEAGDQTQQEEAGDPTQQEEAGDQTQQEEAGDPTQQEEAGDPTQQEEAGDPTQQEGLAIPRPCDDQWEDPGQYTERSWETAPDVEPVAKPMFVDIKPMIPVQYALLLPTPSAWRAVLVEPAATELTEYSKPEEHVEAKASRRQEPHAQILTESLAQERKPYGEPLSVGRVPHLPKPEPRAVESKPEAEPDPEPKPEPDGCPRPPGAGIRSRQPKQEPSPAASVTSSGFGAITEPTTGPKASIERRIPLQYILFDVESACEIRIELEARAEVRFKGEYLPSRDDAMPGRETSTETATERDASRPQRPTPPPAEADMCTMLPEAMIVQQWSQEPMDEGVTLCDPVPVESAPATWEPGALIDFEMVHRSYMVNIDPTPVGSAPPTRAQIEFERRTPIHGAPPQLHHSERIESTAMIDVERMTRRDDTEETHDRSTPLAGVVEGAGGWPQLFFEEPDAGASPSNRGCWPFNWRRRVPEAEIRLPMVDCCEMEPVSGIIAQQRTPEADRRHELSHLVRVPEEESLLQIGGRPCPEEGDILKTERPRDVQCEPGL